MEACEASVRALMCSDGGLGDWCFKGTRDWLFGDRHVIAWWLGMGSGYGVVLWPVKVFARGFRVEGFGYGFSMWSHDAG